jgi:hypothetical protein
MAQLYDAIGAHYARYRRPDPRVAAAITAALGQAQRVVNIGAGAGSYEPKDRDVIAVEPSETMLRQRPLDAVTSTGRCNTGLKSFCRRLVTERHARALVELPCDVV